MELFSNTDIDYYIIQNLVIIILVSLVILMLAVLIYRYAYKRQALENLDIINISGGICSYAIIVNGINNSEILEDLADQMFITCFLAFISLGLINLSRFVFKKTFIQEISNEDNLSYSLINFINAISSAIIIRSLIIWVDIISPLGLITIVSASIINEIICVIANKIYTGFRFKRSLNEIIITNNFIKMTSYAGYRIGLSIIITGSTVFVPYDVIDIINTIITMVEWSLVIAGVFAIVSKIVNTIVNKVINIDNEIGQAVLEASIYVSFSLLTSSLIW